jgi:hypothetical protein
VHTSVAHGAALTRSIRSIGTDPAFNRRFGQQGRDAPFPLVIFVQHVPSHFAHHQRPQRFLEGILILAVEFKGLYQLLDIDAVALLVRQYVIGVGEQYISNPALQQCDIVLALDGGAVFDDFFSLFHGMTFHQVTGAAQIYRLRRNMEIKFVTVHLFNLARRRDA